MNMEDAIIEETAKIATSLLLLLYDCHTNDLPADYTAVRAGLIMCTIPRSCGHLDCVMSLIERAESVALGTGVATLNDQVWSLTPKGMEVAKAADALIRQSMN